MILAPLDLILIIGISFTGGILLGCYFTFKTVFFIYRNSSQRSSESVVQAEQIGQEIIIRK